LEPQDGPEPLSIRVWPLLLLPRELLPDLLRDLLHSDPLTISQASRLTTRRSAWIFRRVNRCRHKTDWQIASGIKRGDVIGMDRSGKRTRPLDSIE
jgi:hypothetical protein